MKRTSIKTAILIPSLAVLIAGIIIMATVVGTLSSNTANDITALLIESDVSECANEFRVLCMNVYSALTAATPIISNYTDPEFVRDVSDPRGEVTDILSKVLVSNDEIVSMWTCWEPDAFDGKDSEYAGTSFYDATGRFVPYVYKYGNGYKIEALVDYDDPKAGEYYLGARNTGKPYMTDPYSYNFGGTDTLICSLAIPILQNGKVVGVVGADINLDKFIALMNDVKILDDGYVYVLSPGGLFATHPHEDLIMKHYDTTWMKNYSTQTESALKNGGSFNINAYSDVTNSNVSFLGSGVKIGETGRYWLICGVIPEESVNASSFSLLWATIIIGFSLIVVVGVTIFLIVRSRLKNLPKLTAIAEAIAEGDIDLANLDAGTEITKNEIALLDRAFYKMATGIGQQEDILSRISQGDYSVTLPVRSDKDTINKAINQMLDSTNKTLNHINTAASQVSAGSKQIADGAQLLAQGSGEQSLSVEELSASINEIANKTNQNVKIAQEAANLSSTIKGSAEKGSAQMNQMMRAVTEITEASSQIEKVIKVIDDIAFQTNILALNAAVEAARAGNAGKGFAVVADEVRNLAAKSAGSARDTGGMIENSIEKANLGLAIATETSESLKEIAEGINRSVEIVAQIAQASNEQALAIAQINTGIDKVSHVIQVNSATAEESAAASEQLSGQSELLTELTSKFKLKDTN